MKDVTPAKLRCAMSMSCPAIFEREDGYWIIGKAVETPAELRDRIGPGEALVWVPRGLVKPGDES